VAEFVTIRHESQPEDVAGARATEKAFDSYYSKKGWVKVGDAPATVAINDPSPTVSEQVRLLEADPDKLVEVLAPADSTEAAAATDATATSTKRGGKS